MQLNNKIVAALIISLITIGIIGVFINLFLIGKPIKPSSIIITNIDVSNGHIKIVGSCTDSAKSYIKYNYSIKDDGIYLKLFYTLPFGKRVSGKFDLNIETTDNVKKIYLQVSESSDVEFIWPK